jgi:hypothetical protein
VIKSGRPRKDTEALTLRVSREMIGQLDDARRQVQDLPTRPEIVRRILTAWAKGEVYKNE